ncbi:MAG: phosphatidate cytidylyltransferase [Chloroflexi bacterium]|nr:phosphatidate cytidylyltransferase [Chloroflexota bacterium]
MTTRLLSAAILLPLVVFIVYVGSLPFTITALLFSVLAGYEFYSLMRVQGYRPFFVLGLLIIALLTVDHSFPLPRNVLLAGTFVAILLWPLFAGDREGTLVNWALTLAGAFYIGWLAAHMVMLRALPRGLAWTTIAMLGTWATDSGAFLAGKTWGHRALAPKISPKKTWEGAIGGFVTGTAITILLTNQWIGLSLPLATACGFLIATAAILGDLIESWIKRQVQAKDSGTIIPGHGGILDRIDSLLLVGVVVYYFALRIGGG